MAFILQLNTTIKVMMIAAASLFTLSAHIYAAPGSIGFQAFKDSSGLAPGVYAEIPLGEQASVEVDHIWERPVYLTRLTLRYGGELGVAGAAVLANTDTQYLGIGGNSIGYGGGLWLHSTVADVYSFRFDYGYYLFETSVLAVGEASVRVSGRANEFGEYGIRNYTTPGKSVTRYYIGLGLYF